MSVMRLRRLNGNSSVEAEHHLDPSTDATSADHDIRSISDAREQHDHDRAVSGMTLRMRKQKKELEDNNTYSHASTSTIPLSIKLDLLVLFIVCSFITLYVYMTSNINMIYELLQVVLHQLDPGEIQTHRTDSDTVE
jgi:hypothetical protein